MVNHPFASPLLLAKQAATVDVLSVGRLDLGIGNGWLPEEFTVRADLAYRGARAEEYVAALRRCGHDDRGYHGSFYDIPPGRQDPPPVQRPGPPILLGGTSEAAMEPGGWIGDGWTVPVGGRSVEDRRVGQGGAERRHGGRARGPAWIVFRAGVRPG